MRTKRALLTWTTAAGLLAAAVVTLPTGAPAQDRPPPSQRDRPPVERERDRDRVNTTTTTLRRASNLIGSPVAFRDGGALGKVQDIVLNEHGVVDYLIVRTADDYVAVPWGAMTYNARTASVALTGTLTRARLRPVTFRGARWPDFASEAWQRDARAVWGADVMRRPTFPVRPGSVRPSDQLRDTGRDGTPAPVRPSDLIREQAEKRQAPPKRPSDRPER